MGVEKEYEISGVQKEPERISLENVAGNKNKYVYRQTRNALGLLLFATLENHRKIDNPQGKYFMEIMNPVDHPPVRIDVGNV